MNPLHPLFRQIFPLLEKMSTGLRTLPRISQTDWIQWTQLLQTPLPPDLPSSPQTPSLNSALSTPLSMPTPPKPPLPFTSSQSTPSPLPSASTPPSAPASFLSTPESTFTPIPTALTSLEELKFTALNCTRCPHLVTSRTQVVFGVGNPHADLMFVGEAPGADEDAQGEPFVGRAGQLQTKIIETMGLTRAEVYIANVLKCRPDMPPGMSGNRKPKVAEIANCLPWLKKQVELIQPKVLVALGATAMEGLLGNTYTLQSVRGQWLEFQGIPLMITYHPSYLLRNQSIAMKRKVWEDMLQVLERLGRPISAQQRRHFT